jgi:orotate phosphoribosyltransferase
LKQNGAVVLGMVALFTYAFPVAEENFAQANCDLHTLSDYPNLISELQESGAIDQENFETLISWRKDPANWKK